MAKLTTAERAKLQRPMFALSGRRFPIEDADHAKAAPGLAARSHAAGNITAGEEKQVDAKAHSYLQRHPIHK
jgi:hypothetical protein